MEDHDTPSESLEFKVEYRKPKTTGSLDTESSGYSLRRKKTTGSLSSKNYWDGSK